MLKPLAIVAAVLVQGSIPVSAQQAPPQALTPQVMAPQVAPAQTAEKKITLTLGELQALIAAALADRDAQEIRERLKQTFTEQPQGPQPEAAKMLPDKPSAAPKK